MAYRRGRRAVVAANGLRRGGAPVNAKRRLTVEEQEKVLDSCHQDIRSSLDMKELFPHLVQQGLLTRREKHPLQLEATADEDKADRLLSWLPKKGNGVLKKFVTCLKNSSDGTAHGDLAKKIEVAVRNVMARKVQKKRPPTFLTGCISLALVFVLVSLGVFAAILFWGSTASSQPARQQAYQSRSLPYGRLSELFIGRDEDVANVTGLLDYDHSPTRIVSIVGSPGFGKSMLAIHVGDQMAKMGVIVHYINTFDVSTAVALTEKVLVSIGILVQNYSISNWALGLDSRTLLIFDNCDESLHQNQDEFQQLVGSVLEASQYLKVLTTSRRRVLYLENYRLYKISELSGKHGSELLQKVVPKLSKSERHDILDVTGNVPLALKIMGSLLQHHPFNNPSAIIKDLQNYPIQTLSSDELPGDRRVFSTMLLSYDYLEFPVQICARYLANFPGGFDKSAAEGALSGHPPYNTLYLVAPYCLESLVQASLLEKGDQHGYYRFHKLIKEFFLYIQSNSSPEEREDFELNYMEYYRVLLSKLVVNYKSHPYDTILWLKSEKPNFRHLFGLLQHSPDVVTMVTTVRAITLSIQLNLLPNCFSLPELDTLLRNLLEQFDRNLDAASQEIGYLEYFKLYVDLMEVRMRLPGNRGQCKIMYARSQYIDWLASYAIGKEAAESYIEYYHVLAKCFTYQRRFSNVLKCQDRISQKAAEMERFKDYDNRTIARAYFHAGQFNRSIYFHNLAKEDETNVLFQVIDLRSLHDLYITVGESSKANEVINEARLLSSRLATVHITPINYKAFVDLARFYSSVGLSKQATKIMERLLTFFIQFHGKNSTHTISFALTYADFLNSLGNSSEAIQVITFAVDLSRGIKTASPMHFVNTLQKAVLVHTKAEDFSEVVSYQEELLMFMHVEHGGYSPEENQALLSHCWYLTLFERMVCLGKEIGNLSYAHLHDANYAVLDSKWDSD